MIPSESVFVCSLSRMRRPTRNHTCFRSRWTVRKSTLPSLQPTTFSARISTTPLPFNAHFVEDTFQWFVRRENMAQRHYRLQSSSRSSPCNPRIIEVNNFLLSRWHNSKTSSSASLTPSNRKRHSYLQPGRWTLYTLSANP